MTSRQEMGGGAHFVLKYGHRKEPKDGKRGTAMTRARDSESHHKTTIFARRRWVGKEKGEEGEECVGKLENEDPEDIHRYA